MQLNMFQGGPNMWRNVLRAVGYIIILYQSSTFESNAYILVILEFFSSRNTSTIVILILLLFLAKCNLHKYRIKVFVLTEALFHC